MCLVILLSRSLQLADLILQVSSLFLDKENMLSQFFPTFNQVPSSKWPELVEWTEETSDVAEKVCAAKTWLST